MNLVLGNAYDELLKMDRQSVDAIVTDPPFGLGKNYINGKELANNPEDYWKFLEPIYLQMLRIIKPGGFICIWQTQLYFPYFWNWFGSNIHIYAGCKNFVQLRKTPINYGYDPIIMYYDSWGEPLRPTKPKRNIDFFVANTAKFVTEKNSLARKHPFPRPIDQTEIIVNNFVIEGGIVLDPFMGSGTTGLACENLGREFIGIEIEPTYFELAKQRLTPNQ